MKASRLILLGFACATMIVGCDRATTEPAHQSSAQPAPAAAPTPQPTASSMIIGQRQQWFAPARIRFSQSDGKLVARLYSDDPSNVLDGRETVNSFDFRMVLPKINSPAEISKAVWLARAPSMDRQDSPYGIFLDNEQQVLQPLDAQVHFWGAPPTVWVSIKGNFCLYRADDHTPGAPPVIVPVDATIQATVPAK